LVSYNNKVRTLKHLKIGKHSIVGIDKSTEKNLPQIDISKVKFKNQFILDPLMSVRSKSNNKGGQMKIVGKNVNFTTNIDTIDKET